MHWNIAAAWRHVLGFCFPIIPLLRLTPNPASARTFITASTAVRTGLAAIAGVILALSFVDPACAKAKIEMSFNPTTIEVGGTSTLTIIVSAAQLEVAVDFTDNLPAGLVVATPNGVSLKCIEGGITVKADPGSSTISTPGITNVIGGGGNCTTRVNVTANAIGPKSNSVTVKSLDGDGNTATATLTVNPASPPTISKAFSPSSIEAGGSTRLSFSVVNPNAHGPLFRVRFIDTLPSGLVISTPNGLMGSCGNGAITATAGSGSVELSPTTLAAAASCTFSVNVTATSTGVKNNSVTVTSSSAGTGNTATATLTVAARASPPSISKAFAVPSIPRSRSRVGRN
jgi:hypothetical protein